MNMDYARPRELTAGEVLRLLRAKWKWLLLWGLTAGLLAGIATACFAVPVYRAGVTLYVYAAQQYDGSISAGDLAAAESLAVTYREMLQSHTVLSAVCDQLDSGLEAEKLAEMIEISVVTDTQLLRIEAVTGDPELSRDIAGAFAVVAPGELARVTRAGGVELLEGARLPDEPEGPGALKNGIFALAAGMTAAAVWVLLGNIYGGVLHNAADVTARTRLPVLGEIPIMAPKVLGSDSAASVREAYSLLGSGLMLARPGDGCRVFLVTGPGGGEGRSLTAANLAASLAMLGQRTLLMDCDMRDPAQHRLWNTEDRGGLRNLLKKDGKCAIFPVEGLPLWVMPSGGTAADSARLLASRRFEGAVRCLRERYDCLVLDAPPLLGCSDARLAARCADGVVLVVRAGKTRREALLEAAGALDHAVICGVVVNGVKETSGVQRERR